MKILLFKTGAIGDTIMTTPLVRQLKKAYPHAEIDYMIGNVASQVLEGNPHIDKIIRFDPNTFFKSRLFEWLRLIDTIKKGHYNMIIILDKHWTFNLTAFLTGIKRRVGFDRLGKEGIFLTDSVYYGNDKHEIYYYLDILEAMDIKPDYKDWKTELFINTEDKKFADKVWKKYALSKNSVIAIAPGGGKNAGEKTEYRNWPKEKYAELTKSLAKKHSIILLGLKEDLEKTDYILESLKKYDTTSKIISLSGRCSIKQSAAIIQKCHCLVCNDTGIMHIGGAVNKRVISIFGPTRPDRKAPLWKESRSIWKDKKNYEEIYEIYGIKSDKKFMEDISINDVLKCI